MALNEDLLDLIEHENTQAQGLLRHLADALPGSASARVLLAASHLRRLEFDQALAHYREALVLEPKNNEALHSAALCLLAKGDYPAALAAYRHAFSLTSSATSLRHGALLSHRLGRLDEAITAYDRVLTASQPTSPEVPIAMQGIAAALRDAGRPLEADFHTRGLLQRFQKEPSTVASKLVALNNSEDFHEWSNYADKSLLAAALTRRLETDRVGARVPETFVLPQDRDRLAAFAASPEAPALYIIKPARSSGGQGISVTNRVTDALDRQDVVVQRYLDRPFLVDGRKGHVRVYGLVTSAEPLRAYVYTQGVVRFAPEPYDPRPDAPGGVSMHITNTALHVGHPGLSISQDPAAEDQGSIWSMSALLRRMTAEGRDGQATFGEIKALVAWFVRMLQADGLFARQAASSPPGAFPFKLFGLDVLIDADGHPWLIEMQRLPAAGGAPLVQRINSTLFADIFRMGHGPLLRDGMAPDQAAQILSDPEARRRRALEIEAANLGGFTPLDL